MDGFDGTMTELRIPLNTVPGRLSEFDPTKHYIVHCKMGGRSAKAYGVLKEAGFQKIDMHASEKKSVEELQAILEEIKVTIQKDNKTKFVRNMAKNGMEALGGILVATTKQMEFAKLASVMDDDADFFEPELEEMAIEMDPSYIPGPKARFMFKLGSLIYKVYQETEMYQNQKYESLNKKKNNPPPS